MADDLLTHFRGVRRQVIKWTPYFAIYERLLSPYRGRPITLVEVGVGDGGSLQGWRAYLGPSARIIGIDRDAAARQLESDGFEIIIGDQADPAFWARHLPALGPIDVLIDDGGHSSVQQIVTVAAAIPHVRDGGVIVVEDTHTAYMPKQYPAAKRFGFMQFAHHVVDALHLRNDWVTKRVSDTANLRRAVYSVQFFESMAIFHVDRRLCGPSEMFEAGVEQLSTTLAAATPRSRLVAALEAQPQWLQWLAYPARRTIGIVLRTGTRIADANRVRRYFR